MRRDKPLWCNVPFYRRQNGNTAMVNSSSLKARADPICAERTAVMNAARTGKPGAGQSVITRGCGANARERRGQMISWGGGGGHAEAVDC